MAGKTSRPGRGARSGIGPRPSGLARPKGRRRPTGPAGPDGDPSAPGYDPADFDGPPYGNAPYGNPPYGNSPYDDPAGGYGPPSAGSQGPPGRRPPAYPHPADGPYPAPHPADGPYPAPHPDDEPDDMPHPRARRPKRPGAVPPIAFFGAAAVVVFIAVVATVAVFVLGGDGGHDQQPQQQVTGAVPKVKGVRAEGPGASAYSQAASTAAFAEIADRAKDPKPLTAGEVFTPKKITDDDANASLRLSATSLESRCAAAIWGEDLAGRLQQGGCTQAARSAYEDKNFDALVTIFNLVNDRAADQVVADADPKAANGFPLVPPKATAFDQGFSIARGVAMGHYAVITWVRHADGSGNESDAALLSLLVTAGKPNAVLVRATGRDPRP
jgi:hypothetical protein